MNPRKPAGYRKKNANGEPLAFVVGWDGNPAFNSVDRNAASSPSGETCIAYFPPNTK